MSNVVSIQFSFSAKDDDISKVQDLIMKGSVEKEELLSVLNACINEGKTYVTNTTIENNDFNKYLSRVHDDTIKVNQFPKR